MYISYPPFYYFPSFPFSNVLYNPTDLKLWQMTPFENMTGRTALIEGLLLVFLS